MDDIVQEFLVESHENLDQLDRDLVALEQSPGSRDLLASIFRTIHTIKGTSGFLAYGRLESVTHVGETLLARLRDGTTTVTPERVDVLLLMVDAVRRLLARIEETGGEEGVDVEDVVARITAVLEGREVAAAAPAAATAPEPAEDPAGSPEPEPLGAALVHSGAATPEAVGSALAAQLSGDARPVGEILVESGAATTEAVEEALGSQKLRAADASIRVDVDLLERLMRLVGELVLTRNQIVQHAATTTDAELQRAAHRLDLVAGELQEGVMKTRMQQIDHLWSKLPRVVRDLGSQCGKAVRLEMEGRETELDRTLLEAVKDPLTHLVRNAVDHGIEAPSARAASGKAESGTLLLRAFHEGGQVVVEVSDDGAGIDPERVRAKAAEKGLVPPAALEAMGTAEVLQLIFAPGFSTAAAVTNVSGRGVGMDVVKTNIERIGGSIEVESAVGEGTTCRLRIPLTLAIVPALTVACSGERYAIPQASLLELVSLDGERGRTGVEHVGGAEVYRLRGSLLPLVRLHEVLGLEPAGDGERLVIAVLESDGRRFGLVLDKVLNTEEIVVKPLSPLLKGIGAYSGATILGDGGVALILDVQALSRRSLRGEVAERQMQAVGARSESRAPEEHLLVVGIGDGRRVAIPLATVTRLEEVRRDAVEHVGRREAVQYRQEIVPLVRLSQHLGAYGADDRESMPVVVSSARGRTVAIAVEEILDIVTADQAAARGMDDAGLLGSTVIRDRITELLDVRQAVLAADPHFFDDLDDIDAATAALAGAAQEV